MKQHDVDLVNTLQNIYFLIWFAKPGREGLAAGADTVLTSDGECGGGARSRGGSRWWREGRRRVGAGAGDCFYPSIRMKQQVLGTGYVTQHDS